MVSPIEVINSYTLQVERDKKGYLEDRRPLQIVTLMWFHKS